jgi:hypothetical protein
MLDISSRFGTLSPPSAFGRRGSVCKVKQDHHENDGRIVDIYIHGYCYDWLADTIQQQLCAEAQGSNSLNGFLGSHGKPGEALWESLHPNSPGFANS